jgi:hypothetical protein
MPRLLMPITWVRVALGKFSFVNQLWPSQPQTLVRLSVSAAAMTAFLTEVIDAESLGHAGSCLLKTNCN